MASFIGIEMTSGYIGVMKIWGMSDWHLAASGSSHAISLLESTYLSISRSIISWFYNPHNYRYNPLINPSEIVLINQLNAFTNWGTTFSRSM